MNKNAQRSVRLLEEAFLSLLSEKPYEKITVTDVAERAGLNRGTFYAHFTSMADLTEQVMNDLISRLVNLIAGEFEGTFISNPMPALTRLGAFFEENRALFSKLSGTEGLLVLMSSLTARLEAWFLNYVRSQGSADQLGDLVLGHYVFAGIAGAYHGWIVGELGDCTIDEVNDRLCRFIKSTGTGVLPEMSAGAGR